MKFDVAYCISLDDKLSIYDVRDLNFDETVDFDSAKEHFQCPNDICRMMFEASNELGTFNAKNVNYIRTPHFKNLTTTRHMEGCPYGASKTGGNIDGLQAENDREEHFPSELLLTRREYVRKPTLSTTSKNTPDENRPIAPIQAFRPHPERRDTPDTTSIFAHPVECFVSNIDDKDLLKRMPLKIGEHTASYASFFKKIEYLQDNKGLIYWGKIKQIKDYTQSFRIDFEQKVWFKAEGEARKKPYSVNVYLSKKLIDNYRKHKAFLEEIKLAIDNQRELYCFFYGVTPAFKHVPSKKNPEASFGVFSADIENLDHFIIREAAGVEAK
ncbi:hypothetical protein [Pseudomonas sessilinigenes]|uniref:Uncharacterized protein n=1 Tax=Pseudomonas sessilinigenes TaxID=658629 RepID=A0ABX8MHM5_9PSED|nr:hypothetical protein [Pseudomonas sessilinigenes]AZC25019.1 hypothetical protein C4K39_3346 [Pseudomonas sessilinigenes]QXH38057.1 hypothetical protein KSS89_17370 [Pseudomonas sessilinigenes]